MTHRHWTGSLSAHVCAHVCAFAAALAAGCGHAPKEPDVGKAAGPPQNITCPAGQVLTDTKCVPAPPKPSCPPGQIEKDGACAPAPSECPPGTHAGADGKTCVADENPNQVKTDAPQASRGPCPAGMIFVKG